MTTWGESSISTSLSSSEHPLAFTQAGANPAQRNAVRGSRRLNPDGRGPMKPAPVTSARGTQWRPARTRVPAPFIDLRIMHKCCERETKIGHRHDGVSHGYGALRSIALRLGPNHASDQRIAICVASARPRSLARRFCCTNATFGCVAPNIGVMLVAMIRGAAAVCCFRGVLARS